MLCAALSLWFSTVTADDQLTVLFDIVPTILAHIQHISFLHNVLFESDLPISIRCFEWSTVYVLANEHIN